MNDTPEQPIASELAATNQASPAVSDPLPFERADWLVFWITTGFMLCAYLFTLAPEVTLEFSGLLSTGAMYTGVAHPPGHPFWTLYAWSFTQLLPFSNIAWRVAVSSAVAGALTCGLIALLVTRGSAILLENLNPHKRLASKDETLLRRVCGFLAATGFGFHRVFWGQAVIAETMGLGMLLLAIVLCSLLHWAQAPTKSVLLHVAFLVYGLALAVKLSLVAATPGLLLILVFRSPSLGRDFAFVLAAGLVILLASGNRLLPEVIPGLTQLESLERLYRLVAIMAGLLCGFLVFTTRRILTHWRTVCCCTVLFAGGLSLYSYTAVASMTNPPVNWGYARSVEGWVHLLSRGQYEHLILDCRPLPLLDDFGQYAGQTVRDLGLAYVLAAVVPLAFMRKMKARERGWLLGLLATFLSLSVLMLAGLNVPPGRDAMEFASVYFPASHLVLAVAAGYGLALVGWRLQGWRPETGSGTASLKPPDSSLGNFNRQEVR